MVERIAGEAGEHGRLERTRLAQGSATENTTRRRRELTDEDDRACVPGANPGVPYDERAQAGGDCFGAASNSAQRDGAMPSR